MLKDPACNAVGGSRRDGPDTSRRAALDNYPQSGSQRWKVLMALVESEDQGATYAELAEMTGLGGGASGSAGKRVSELRRDGWIEPTGRTRLTPLGSESQVMVVTDAGLRELQARYQS